MSCMRIGLCPCALLPTLRQHPVMDALRKRKVAACNGTVEQGRVLRSTSGKIVTEQALADAVQQKTKVSDAAPVPPPARGLVAAVATSDSQQSLSRQGSRKRAPKDGGRRAASAGGLQQVNSAPAVLANDAGDSVPDLTASLPASAGPAVSLAAPTSWTEASMTAALEHLCKADPCAP